MKRNYNPFTQRHRYYDLTEYLLFRYVYLMFRT